VTDVDDGQSRTPLTLGIFFLVHFFTYEHGGACFLLCIEAMTIDITRNAAEMFMA
jgi:hypothetical protein